MRGRQTVSRQAKPPDSPNGSPSKTQALVPRSPGQLKLDLSSNPIRLTCFLRPGWRNWQTRQT